MTLELIITGAAVIVLVAVLAWAVTVKCKTQGVNDQSPSTKNQKNLGLTPISELNAASDGPWFVYDTTTEAEALSISSLGSELLDVDLEIGATDSCEQEGVPTSVDGATELYVDEVAKLPAADS